MELSIESCQHATWKVRDFFQLPSEIGYSLDSPEIRFAGYSYCLRLYPNGCRKSDDKGCTELHVVSLTSTFPERKVLCKIGYKCRFTNGNVGNTYKKSNALNNYICFDRSYLEEKRDMFVLDGSFTVLCSMCLEEPSSAGIGQSETPDSKLEQKGLLAQSLFISSRLVSLQMELSIDSPCQQVTWKVPEFFQLVSKIGGSLNSPDFRFTGDRYCLQFYPKRNRNGDTVDTDLRLVRLTSTFPEIIVLYKVGYIWRNYSGVEYDIYDYSGALIGDFGFCLSRSQLQGEGKKYLEDGTFTVLISLRLKEQSSARSPQSEEGGSFHTEEEQEGITAGNVMAHDFEKAVPGSSACSIQAEDASIMIDKENPNNNLSSLDMKDDAVLRDRMKELLTKGKDYDVTICVQDKEFKAHRIILSASSPVFAMMFSHDTKENSTNTISIEDCDPESFDEFLLYVYSERTKNLSPSNALQLYYSADKYNFPLLKERCVSLLKTSLSITSICDVVLLAAKHQEKELLEVATKFFAQNVKKIIVTVGWQNFLSQNPVEANELYINTMEILHPEN